MARFVCSRCEAPYKSMPKDMRCTRCFYVGTIVEHLKVLRPNYYDLPETSNAVAEEAAKIRAEIASGVHDTEPVANNNYNLRCLSDVSHEKVWRVRTGYRDFDALLGGGLVRGTVVVLGGEAGAGKSSMALQLIKHVDDRMVYHSAEQQEARLRQAALRLGLKTDKILAGHTHDIDDVLASKESCVFEVIDSLQAYVDATDAPFIMKELQKRAQANNNVIIVVSRLNKQGRVAGASDVEYDGDCTIFVRMIGVYDEETQQPGPERLIQVAKNRDGPAPKGLEVEMGDRGLIFDEGSRRQLAKGE